MGGHWRLGVWKDSNSRPGLLIYHYVKQPFSLKAKVLLKHVFILYLTDSNMFQVGAISPQNMQQVLQNIRECLESSDWATRKAAADTLCILSSHSSHLVGDGATSIITSLESCRFDKVTLLHFTSFKD